MIDITAFRTRYPEFSDISIYPDSIVQMYIDDAVVWMSDEVRWLDFYDLAQYCLVAHFIAVSDASGTGDSGPIFPISKQEVDDVIIEQAVEDTKATLDNINSTIYGQCYRRYRRMCFSGIYSV